MKPIYLDNSSTKPIYKEVAELIKKSELENYGNPSSPHRAGEKALSSITKSRIFVSKEINAKPNEIIFTSGATESNNIAILGMAKSHPEKKKIIISSIEHSSVYEPCQYLKSIGYEISEIPVNSEGILNIELLEKEINQNTLLVSIIHAHNEIGVIQDIEKIGRICKSKSVPLHIDSSQIFSKEKIDVKKLNISLLSASAHKIGGPKGIGLLYIKESLNISPITYGGSQEFGFHPGTQSPALSEGFAKSLEISKKINKEKIKALRNFLIEEISEIGGKINGSISSRLYDNIHFSLPVDSEMLVSYLSQKGIYCSSRSACTEKQESENRTLKAIKLPENYIKGSLRISLNEFTKIKDIKLLLKEIKRYLKI